MQEEGKSLRKIELANSLCWPGVALQKDNVAVMAR